MLQIISFPVVVFSSGKKKKLDSFFFFAKIFALHIDPSLKGCLMGFKYI